MIKMSEFDFSYVIPNGFKKNVSQLLSSKSKKEAAIAFNRVNYEYNDLGLAYYNGLKGNNWNKNAINFTLEGSNEDINLLRSNEQILRECISVALKPSESGLLLKDIYYLRFDDEYKIELPEEDEDSFEVLSNDIKNALAKNEPVLVLDRLHTYSTKYIRNICLLHGISVEDEKGCKYSLHSLIGQLNKYYRNNKTFQSEFSESAIKMSISLFENFNKIRNDQSFAHDNQILNNDEASYVVRMIEATLTFIEKIEKF